MADFILIDGDQAIFMPSFGAAIVAVQPGTLTATGAATFNGTKVCIQGDETSVQVPGCTYISGPHTVPGSGTLLIESLASDHVASLTHSSNTPVMLKGSLFKAKFQVASPATIPVATTPDPVPVYSGGQGQFVTQNAKFKGT